MKNTILFNVIFADLISEYGADKVETFVRAYEDYTAEEFGNEYTDTELLKEFEPVEGIGIAYTTGGEDEEWDLQTYYDWRAEEMVYTASDGEHEFAERESYTIDEAIEYGFSFDDAYSRCNGLIEEEED